MKKCIYGVSLVAIFCGCLSGMGGASADSVRRRLVKPAALVKPAIVDSPMVMHTFDTSRGPYSYVVDEKKIIKRFADQGDSSSSKRARLLSNKRNLINACIRGHYEEAKRLLENGVDVNCSVTMDKYVSHTDPLYPKLERVFDDDLQRDPQDVQVTPLLAAAVMGRMKVAKLLIERGADISMMDGMGQTPMVVAFIHGHHTMGDLLVAQLPEVSKSDEKKIDLLASQHRVAQVFKSHGAEGHDISLDFNQKYLEALQQDAGPSEVVLDKAAPRPRKTPSHTKAPGRTKATSPTKAPSISQAPSLTQTPHQEIPVYNYEMVESLSGMCSIC